MTFRVDVKRKKGERFETLLRRFNTRVIRSGKIFDARDARFRKKGATKAKLKEGALRRITNREKRAWLLKTGQLVEDPRRKRRR